MEAEIMLQTSLKARVIITKQPILANIFIQCYKFNI